MALLEILQPPHPLLKTKAQPVDHIDDALRRLAADMFETMYKAPGIGLAAPQVGVLQRLIVVDVAEGEERRPMALVNPEIVWQLRGAGHRRGRLPQPARAVRRRDPARRRSASEFTTEHGEARELPADGLLARCLQHEVDHLDGILFVDHLSALRRNMILRRLAKARRARA